MGKKQSERFMGKVSGYGYIANADGSFTIPPCHDDPHEEIQAERVAVRSLLRYTYDHATEREKVLFEREREWWKKMAEDLGISLEGWGYDFTTRTFTPPKQGNPTRDSNHK